MSFITWLRATIGPGLWVSSLLNASWTAFVTRSKGLRSGATAGGSWTSMRTALVLLVLLALAAIPGSFPPAERASNTEDVTRYCLTGTEASDRLLD